MQGHRCGLRTGIVARSLRDRGCTVVGIEPDVRMAQIARRHDIEVEIARFEEWDARRRTFDLLVSGQAWHWVDPANGARKASAVLRPGAHFGVFWNGLRHSDEVAAGFQRIYSRVSPHLLVDSVALGTARPSREADQLAFDETGEFIALEHRTYEWERRYTPDAWLDELPTHSGHRVLPHDTLARLSVEVRQLIDALGGEIVVAYTSAGLFGRRQ